MPKARAGHLRSVGSVFENDVYLDFSVTKIVFRRHPETGKLRHLGEQILSAVSSPDYVFAGKYGENIAAEKIKVEFFKDRWLMVPYKEGGRINTAFIVSNIERLIKGRFVLWKR